MWMGRFLLCFYAACFVGGCWVVSLPQEGFGYGCWVALHRSRASHTFSWCGNVVCKYVTVCVCVVLDVFGGRSMV